jgi:thioredoxin-like negative regulator of GroEL
MTGVDWITATGILLAGAVIGFMFLYVTTRKKSAPPPAAPLEVRDLEAKRDALIAHLRELDDRGGNDEERDRMEQQAADVLRQLDGRTPTLSPQRKTTSDQRPTKNEQRPASSALKGFLWGAGSAAAVAALVFFVVSQAKSREAGGSLTGNAPSAQMQQAPRQQATQPDPELEKLEAAVKASPDDINLRNDLAHAYLARENMVAAFEQAQAVIVKSPGDARANTMQGIVRIAMGESEQAVKQLQSATSADPKLLDAWVALAWAYTQSGRDTEAATAIATAVRQNPSQEARLREVFARMREQAKAQPAAASPRHPATGGAVPAEGGPGIKVTLDVAPGAKRPDSKVVYVIVREAGVTAGPPSAVKRVIVSTFPITVDVTAADSMMGAPLPATMRVEARLDTDGNAMTKQPTDLEASKDGVASGAAVSLTLAQKHP